MAFAERPGTSLHHVLLEPKVSSEHLSSVHEFAEGRQIALKPFAYCRHNRTLADRDNPGRRERFEPCRCAPSKVVSLEQDNGILCVYVFRYTIWVLCFMRL